MRPAEALARAARLVDLSAADGLIDEDDRDHLYAHLLIPYAGDIRKAEAAVSGSRDRGAARIWALLVVVLMLGVGLLAGAARADAELVDGVELYPFPSHRIVVTDGTSPEHWPVRAVERDWGVPTVLSLHVRPRCVAGVPCISITARDYGPTGWSGLTAYPAPLHRQIYLNRYYVIGDRYLERQVLCHEMGHAIGIYDHLGRRSCLYGGVDRTVTNRPGSYALWLVNHA